MSRDEIIVGLEKIAGFFRAMADMAVGEGKMLLLNCVRCAQEAAALIAAQKGEETRDDQKD